MELYPHQIPAAAWLSTRRFAMLLDDAGLGKTITAIAAAKAVNQWPVLVICPSVVLWNWHAEWAEWAPDRRVQVIETGRDDIDGAAHVVLVTSDMIRKPLIRSRLLRTWWRVIVDEAHLFKQITAQRTLALYNGPESILARARSMWLLTATIMPNDATELYTHLSALFPDTVRHPDGRLMTFSEFRAHYCLVRQTRYGIKVVGLQRAAELKAKLEGTFMRRKVGAQDGIDLPPIRFEMVTVKPDVMPHELEELDALLTPKLRSLLAETGDPGQAFTLLKNSTEYARFLHLVGIAKARPVADLLSYELAHDQLDKVVVFAHHRGSVDWIRSTMEEGGFGPLVIQGGMSARVVDTHVRQFQTDKARRVMVCQIIAGGVGITLHAAREAAFVEFDTRPGVNVQAARRIHRIGQIHPCRVRMFAMAGTLDQARVKAIRQKVIMINEVLD
jgi:SNF2 family DNA or RNA helicase